MKTYRVLSVIALFLFVAWFMLPADNAVGLGSKMTTAEMERTFGAVCNDCSSDQENTTDCLDDTGCADQYKDPNTNPNCYSGASYINGKWILKFGSGNPHQECVIGTRNLCRSDEQNPVECKAWYEFTEGVVMQNKLCGSSGNCVTDPENSKECRECVKSGDKYDNPAEEFAYNNTCPQ